jgi:hypothetical protein
MTSITLGCGGDDDGGDSHADAGYDCTTETRADTFVAGLEKVSPTMGYKIRLMESTPAPPKKGDNTWIIQAVDSSETPLTGATVKVTPFMPDHGHGTPIRAEVTEQMNGNYQATPVNLWMPGLWEVTVEVTANAQTDSVVYGICIDQ